MKVTMMLCDAAEQVNGKLYILGGGFTHVFAGVPVSMALAVIVAVPWTETNRRHPLRAVLVDDDGHQVALGDPPQDVQMEAHIEVGRPVGIKPGTDLNAALAFKFQGLMLDPGGYVWEIEIGDTTERTPFWVIGGNA